MSPGIPACGKKFSKKKRYHDYAKKSGICYRQGMCIFSLCYIVWTLKIESVLWIKKYYFKYVEDQIINIHFEHAKNKTYKCDNSY